MKFLREFWSGYGIEIFENLFNAYLLVNVIKLLVYDSQDLFFKMSSDGINLDFILTAFISLAMVMFVEKQLKSVNRSRIRFILLALYSFLALFKSVSIFLSLGLIGLSLIFFLIYYFKREKLAFLMPLAIVLNLPQLLHLANSNQNTEKLGKFAFELTASHMPLLWPMILATILSLLLIYLQRHAHLERLSSIWLKRLTWLILSLGTIYVIYLSVIVIFKVKLTQYQLLT